jgi:hypothetical protein
MVEMPTTRAREPVVMVHGYAVDVAALTPAQNELLEKIANRIRLRLAKQPNIWVEIDVEGHTDSTYTETYNKDLGLRRATGVANQLQSLFSAKFRNRVYLDTRSVGETEPIASHTGMGGTTRSTISVRPGEATSSSTAPGEGPSAGHTSLLRVSKAGTAVSRILGEAGEDLLQQPGGLDRWI